MARTATLESRNKSESGRGREVGGIMLLGLALFVGMSLLSFQFGKGSVMGPVGATVASGVYALLGIGGYLMAWLCASLAVRCLTGRALVGSWVRGAGGVIGTLGLLVLAHL